MKRTTLVFAFLLFSLTSFAQQTENVIEVTEGEQEIVSRELQKEAENKDHDKKTRKFLKKVAKFFKETPKKIVLEIKKLDDCVSCDNKTKGEIIGANSIRAVGKGATWLSVATAKPAMQASGWLTGVLEKKEKNQELIALYQFFLNHSAEFDDLYKEALNPLDLASLMMAQVQEIMEQKARIILQDSLKKLGLDVQLPEDLQDFELSSEQIAKIDLTKVSPDLINKHPEYSELLPIIGEVSQKELMEILTLGYFDPDIKFTNFTAAVPKIHEGILTITGQLIAPKVALGVISKTLGGLYLAPVIAADIGAGISAAVCLSAENREKIKTDEDLRSFCSYVINRSAYELMKSRAKGYVAGKSFRVKLEEKLKKRKEKRAKRKEERRKRRELNG